MFETVFSDMPNKIDSSKSFVAKRSFISVTNSWSSQLRWHGTGNWEMHGPYTENSNI